MANYDLYFPLEVKLEGDKYEEVKGDNGGCTKYGLTLDDVKEYHIDFNNDGIFDCKDVYSIDRPKAYKMLKALYWDYFNADNIPNQSLAEFIVDAGLNQGRVLIVKYIQFIIGVKVDGHYGPTTFSTLLQHITKDGAQNEFSALYQKRLERYNNIVKANPSQSKFLNGWMNRLNAIKFKQ